MIPNGFKSLAKIQVKGSVGYRGAIDLSSGLTKLSVDNQPGVLPPEYIDDLLAEAVVVALGDASVVATPSNGTIVRLWHSFVFPVRTSTVAYGDANTGHVALRWDNATHFHIVPLNPSESITVEIGSDGYAGPGQGVQL